MIQTRLKDRDDLSIFWDNHLRVAFETSAPHDIPAMIEASLAHVVMLGERHALPMERAQRLLTGLSQLWDEFGPGAQQPQWKPRRKDYSFDGSVEDPYYFLEQHLAQACSIPTSELDVQLARSRNDLDAGVFRMILRRGALDVLDLLIQTSIDVLKISNAGSRSLLIGHTHRRPAQPTSIGHVFSGLAQTLISQANDLLSVYDEINVSPLGSAAFTGTDIAIDSQRVAELLGFDSTFTASYEAVAGAEHFMRLAAVYGRITSTGARIARVLQEWMNFEWIKTPPAFCQGSSIMPQKQNPVVLEHMVSMAGASNALTQATYSTIASGWYEDSNNATTDVQKHLWKQTDTVIRFLRLYNGVIKEVEAHRLPSEEDIVHSGATTTAVAETMATQGIPWRGAHHVVGTLFRAGDPTTWTSEQISDALAAAGITPTTELVTLILTSGQSPRRVLDRTQPGSVGAAAVESTNSASIAQANKLAERTKAHRDHLHLARQTLLDTVHSALSPAVDPTITIIGNSNLDVIVHDARAIPEPGTEEIVSATEMRVGGSAAITALRLAQLSQPVRLVSRVGKDSGTETLKRLLCFPSLTTIFLEHSRKPSALTVVAESSQRDRSFLSSLGAMADLSANDIPEHAFRCGFLLNSGYFLLPHLRGKALADVFTKAHNCGAQTALDTGHPAEGWSDSNRAELLNDVLPSVDYFFPNRDELCGLMNEKDSRSAAMRLHEQTGATVFAKLGAEGGLVVSAQGVEAVAAPARTPYDTTGAGDAFNALALNALAHGANPGEALTQAVETASLLVATPDAERGKILASLSAKA